MDKAATFMKLISGKFRARVRVNVQYRGETFASKTAEKRMEHNWTDSDDANLHLSASRCYGSRRMLVSGEERYSDKLD